MSQVFLVEDHDEVLKIWKEQDIKGLDLIHLDAHIDFGFYLARPPEKLLKEAKNVKDLKRRLEFAINFLRYEKDFNKQINIGNYVYPAMDEGIVNNFYWVVPGGKQEFEKSRKTIKRILSQMARFENNKKPAINNRNGAIYTLCLARKIIVCNLQNLPKLTKSLLLDIDVDFLVIDSILNADNTKNIGKRKPWILPKELLNLLKEKIKNPKITTISYSVNGGYTPLKYKYFGDEMAYNLAPLKFKEGLGIQQRVAQYFNLFEVSGRKEYYQKAVRLNPTYRCADNNYGPLYFSKRRFCLAQKEFKRILKVDADNPSVILGLGKIALERKNLDRAKRYFYSAHRFSKNGLFKNTKKELLFNLGRVEFNLKNFVRAKKFLLIFKSQVPMEPKTYYLLGCIYEKEKRFSKAAVFYKDAIRLGFLNVELLSRFLKISMHLKEKNSIINYLILRFNELRKGFLRMKRWNLKKGKDINKLKNTEKKLNELGSRLSVYQRKSDNQKEVANAGKNSFTQE